MSEAERLVYLAKILNRNIGALEKSELSCCGATLGQCHALLEIEAAGELSLMDLAQLLNLDKSTVSRLVNQLVANEWVERVIDPMNRRYVKLGLTPKGSGFSQVISTVFHSYMARVWEYIPENKHAQVLESIELLIQAFDENNCC